MLFNARFIFSLLLCSCVLVACSSQQAEQALQQAHEYPSFNIPSGLRSTPVHHDYDIPPPIHQAKKQHTFLPPGL